MQVNRYASLHGGRASLGARCRSGLRRLLQRLTSARLRAVFFRSGRPRGDGGRDEALARSRGVCQACGQQPAVGVHHWAPSRTRLRTAATADDLIALCAGCHHLTTTLLRFTRGGGLRHELLAKLSEALAQCGRA